MGTSAPDVFSFMTRDLSASELSSDQTAVFRERARRARAIASRYRGEAARVLIVIADDFDARAAGLEAPVS